MVFNCQALCLWEVVRVIFFVNKDILLYSVFMNTFIFFVFHDLLESKKRV